MKVLAYIQDRDVIWKILNHLGLLEEDPSKTLGRSPPDALVASAVGEVVYEHFYDDLEPGEAMEMMMATADVGRN